MIRNSKLVSKESKKTITAILSLLLFFAMARLVQASCSTPIQIQVPPVAPPCCEKCHEICKRSPITSARGEYTFSVLDLQIPTRGAFPAQRDSQLFSIAIDRWSVWDRLVFESHDAIDLRDLFRDAAFHIQQRSGDPASRRNRSAIP